MMIEGRTVLKGGVATAGILGRVAQFRRPNAVVADDIGFTRAT